MTSSRDATTTKTAGGQRSQWHSQQRRRDMIGWRSGGNVRTDGVAGGHVERFRLPGGRRLAVLPKAECRRKCEAHGGIAEVSERSTLLFIC